jgi:hypothetical protein
MKPVPCWTPDCAALGLPGLTAQSEQRLVIIGARQKGKILWKVSTVKI